MVIDMRALLDLLEKSGGNPLEVLEFETLEQAGKVLVRIPKELFKTSIIVPLTKSYLLPA